MLDTDAMPKIRPPAAPTRLLRKALDAYPGGARQFSRTHEQNETAISHVRSRRRMPTPRQRELFAACFGIPVEAWGPMPVTPGPAVFVVEEE